MHWGKEIGQAGGIVERSFVVCSGQREVPGLLWRHDSAKPQPVILVGHGGSASAASMNPRDNRLTAALLERTGACVVAIDGPVHGMRRVGQPADQATVKAAFRDYWRQGDGGRQAMTDDWIAVIGGLRALPDLDADAIGYLGFSMGTAYGVPLCAASNAIRFAIIGGWEPEYPNSAALREHAMQMRMPTLFIQKWDDEVMSRDGQQALFDFIGSDRKQLNVYPGSHSALNDDLIDDVCSYVEKHVSRR